jgi:predicted NAD/FAD-dependent oxidoreductase
VKFDSDKIIERKNWIDDEPRYVGVSSMNKIAKHLAEGLNVHQYKDCIFKTWRCMAAYR